MRLRLPAKVNQIIDTLQRHEFEAYAVGGCVRDSILAREPEDWDITTSAKPEDVKMLFRRTVDTGIEHGTVTVLLGDEGFEVTTYRIDGKYEDGRHPAQVEFCGNLSEDLRRRDFTINAMAYNHETGLVDLFHGMQDLQARIICCVGNPRERFGEDALRILRAVRFAAQLGFHIDEDTRFAIRELAYTLHKVSAERIQVEIVKLLTSGYPEMWLMLYQMGITHVIMPEFDRCMDTPQNTPHHCYNVGEHTLRTLNQVPADKVLRLTMLFHDVGKPESRITDETGRDHFYGHAKKSEEIAGKILHRLRFDNDTIRKVTRLVRFHDYRPEPVDREVRKAIHYIGEDLFLYYLIVQRADATAKSGYQKAEKFARIEAVQNIYENILRRGDCLNLKGLNISGSDLIDLGIKPGRQIGVLLEKALDKVLEDPIYNTKEFLQRFVLSQYGKME